jgi:hypothetical protein
VCAGAAPGWAPGLPVPHPSSTGFVPPPGRAVKTHLDGGAGEAQLVGGPELVAEEGGGVDDGVARLDAGLRYGAVPGASGRYINTAVSI